MEAMVSFHPNLGRARRLRIALMDQRAAADRILAKDTTDDQLAGLEYDYWRSQDDIERLNAERKSPGKGKG